MIISSPAFSYGNQVPSAYTCEGPNISPPLRFEGIPDTAKSLVLSVTDPDAPAKPWVHWLVFNIPVTVRDVPEGKIPEGGVEGYANGGTPGYEGPCPPKGQHTYLFTLYALDVLLDLPQESDRHAILAAAEGHIVTVATYAGTYAKRT